MKTNVNKKNHKLLVSMHSRIIYGLITLVLPQFGFYPMDFTSFGFAQRCGFTLGIYARSFPCCFPLVIGVLFAAAVR